MRTLLVMMMACSFALATNVALAQRDAGSKARGDFNFYGNAAGGAMRSAQSYSGHYRAYVNQTPERITPAVAKEAADSIGDYIVKAKKHMASMRKHAEANNDKGSLAALDSIDKHLADAGKHHEAMRETCLKETVDGKASLECCRMIDDSLAKAIAEHDKLMKHLAGPHGKK